VAWGRRRRSRH